MKKTKTTLVMAALSAIFLAGADWPQFRGEKGTAISNSKGLPESWKADENILWKQALPGFGSSSPIVVGDKIFVTCFQSDGLVIGETSTTKNLKNHLLCLQASDGSLLWDKVVPAKTPEQPYKSFVTTHGYSSSTPASDGQSVYVFFGQSGVWAYDLAGNERWHVSVGEKLDDWGSGTSPILCGDLVIINASVESGSIVALDKATGKQAWKFPGIVKSWSTPALVDLADGRQELVINHKGKVIGLDPKTGVKLWDCVGIDDYVCPAVVVKDSIVYVTAGRKPVTVAIRAGGKGDVSKTNVLWRIDKASKVPTPVIQDGLLYWVDDKGSAMCVKADSGKIVYAERLNLSGGKGDKVYASLVLGDGKLYAVARNGTTVVLAVGEAFRELARNDLGDKSMFNATPAVYKNHLLIRSDSFLYCIGK